MKRLLLKAFGRYASGQDAQGKRAYTVLTHLKPDFLWHVIIEPTFMIELVSTAAALKSVHTRWCLMEPPGCKY